MPIVAQFTISSTRILGRDGETVAPLPAFAEDSKELAALYRVMVLTRTFDATAIALQRVLPGRCRARSPMHRRHGNPARLSQSAASYADEKENARRTTRRESSRPPANDMRQGRLKAARRHLQQSQRERLNDTFAASLCASNDRHAPALRPSSGQRSVR